MKLSPVEKCSFCGQTTQGNHAIHRDGFDVGPEIPLCDACGGESGPTCEEIWARTSTLVWVEKPAIMALLDSHEPAMCVNGRTRPWQLGVALAYAHSTIFVEALNLEFGDLFDSVDANVDLQNAVTSAVRFQTQGFAILMMINEWGGDANESHDQRGVPE